ncbi:hypothetical protein CMV00_11755 [Elizabethkingia anophelis]|nr:hypothetical protein [Elizabethkingia anophelis]
MTSDHIKDIFKDYLKEKDTQYAIMLNGKWGGGKTYFWKEQLQIIARQELKTIYISLNGVAKIENLEYQMLLGQMPYLSNDENKIIKSATHLIGNAANALTKFFTRSSGISDIFKGVVVDNLKYSDKLICFDDLERCKIPLDEVLGFINNFIEHKSLKVLFLADEGKIDNDKYYKAKEKIIRHTLNFEPSIKELFPQLAIKFKKSDPEYHGYLLAEATTLIDIFTEYKENNLRNISFIFDCLQRLFSEFRNIKKEFQIELILFTIIIAIELKTGSIQSTDYNDSKKLDSINYTYYQMIMANRKEEAIEITTEKSYAKIICEKYLSKRIEQYYYFESIYIFVLSGFLDTSKYKAELQHRSKLVTPQEIVDLRAVINYNFRTLKQEDFDRSSAVVWQNAIAGKYNIYTYVQLADFYYFFSDNKLITQTIDEVKDGLINGLNISKKRLETDNYEMSNILAFQKSERVEDFKRIVSKVHEEMKGSNHKKLGDKLIFALGTDNLPALQELMPTIGMNIHLYNEIDKENLLKVIIETSNDTLHSFIKLFTERYSFSNVRDFLKNEKTCIDYLKNGLEAHITTSTSEERLKRLLHRELLEELTNISKNLSAIE